LRQERIPCRSLAGKHALDNVFRQWRSANTLVELGYILQLDAKFYRIDRRDIRTGLRKAHVRVEARLDGSVAVRFNDAYLRVEQGEKPVPVNAAAPAASAQARRAPNAGGKSAWMKTFWDRPSPTLRQAIGIANANS
jgi:hypothetical protein